MATHTRKPVPRRFGWRGALLFTSLLGLVVYQYVQWQFEDELIRQMTEQLALRFPGFEVSIRGASLLQGEGLLARGVVLRDPQRPEPYREVLSLDEIFLNCRTDLHSFWEGDLGITRVVLRRPILRVTHWSDGSWGLDPFQKCPTQCSGSPPKIRIEGGTLLVCEVQEKTASTYTIRDIQLELIPKFPAASPTETGPQLPPAASARAETSPKSATNSQTVRVSETALVPDTATVREAQNLPVWDVQGSFRGDYLQRVEFQGSLAPATKLWNCAGKIEGLELGPELREMLPSVARRYWDQLPEIRAQTQFQFTVNHDPTRKTPYQFQVISSLKRGHILDRRLPLPLSDLEATLSCTPAGITLHELRARSGEATLKGSGHWAGWAPDSSFSFRASATLLPLDARLLRDAPRDWQAAWDLYSPSGRIDLEASISREGALWRTECLAQPRDVAFTHAFFPYRLEHTHGLIRYRNGNMDVDLQAFAGTQPLQIRGHIDDVGPAAGVHVTVTAEALRCDERLLRAMPSETREVLHRLHPSGSFDLWMDMKRARGLEEVGRAQVRMTFQDGALEYEKFRYPLYDIRGIVEGFAECPPGPVGSQWPQWHWSFRDFSGRNDTGQVLASGELTSPDQGSEFRLNLEVAALPLDEELRQALTPAGRAAWERLQVQGAVNLQTRFSYSPARGPQLWARIEPLAATIQLKEFPYRLEQVHGAVILEDGKLKLESLRAVHGRVKLAAEGTCEFGPEGDWRLLLTNLHAERLPLERERDPEFFQALPPAIKKFLEVHRPTGPLSLQGKLVFAGGPSGLEPLQTEWEISLELGGVTFDGPAKLERLFGRIHFQGQAQSEQFRAQAELDLDSLQYKDLQFTEIRGPLVLDEKQVVLGSWKSLQLGEQWNVVARNERHVTAKFMSGMIYGDGLVQLGIVPQYWFKARLNEGDLGRFAREVLPGRQQNFGGQVDAQILLQGTGGLHTVQGKGSVQLREADVYELPVMVSLLSILRLRPPGSQAFDESDIQFRLDGKWIYFDNIEFRGDAVSLRGRGSLDLSDRALQLQFYSLVGRDEGRIPVLSQVLGGASRSLLQIHVEGSVDEPKTRAQAVPAVTGALQQLFQELETNQAADRKRRPRPTP